MHFLLIQKTWRTVAHHVASRIRPTSVRLCISPDLSLPMVWGYADCAADMSVPGPKCVLCRIRMRPRGQKKRKIRALTRLFQLPYHGEHVMNAQRTAALDPNDAQLVVVANRLPLEPVYADIDKDTRIESWRLAPGGLVSALDAILRDRPALWIGSGDSVPDEEPGCMRLAAVAIPPVLAHDYYEGFSNSAIWPLYHDAVVTPEFHRHHFEAYRKANELFADRVAELADEGATVWVHDYQLQLLPRMLRERRPDLTLGFFLHIPFPPAELFAQLPWRRQILQGLLGSDLVGFQTHRDATNFLVACERVLGLANEGHGLRIGDRRVRVEAFPIGIDALSFSELAAQPEVQARAHELRAGLGDPDTLILGVDRLDYTKGIDIRLKAFAELLESGRLDPTKTVFVQVAVPSRENVSEYQQIRDEIELLVGRFNGALANFGSTPIHYQRRVLERAELVALYMAADIMLVTPLRDGMNLVCKEYVATRNDDSGALILSEFAGAAAQLRDAWLVNPHDTAGVEQAIADAVHASPHDRKVRMQRMRDSVFGLDAAAWATEFLRTLHMGQLNQVRENKDRSSLPIRELATTPHLLVCCDYDGTLAPIVDDPSQARPLDEAVAALRALSLLPSTTVAVISGRALRDLAALSRLPSEIHLVGSHGWEVDQGLVIDAQQRELLDRVIRSCEVLVAEIPGAHVETKPGSIAVHVRRCEPLVGNALIEDVVRGPGQYPGVLIRHGKAVIELSVVHTQKADAVNMLRHRVGATTIMFVGDDVTDESVFTTLTGPDVGIKVGDGDTAAPWRVDSPHSVAELLFDVAGQRERWLLGGHASPIEDYALLSNRHSVALLSPTGSIDWLCAPEPGSPAVFARLIGDDSSGHFSVHPAHGKRSLSQTYVPGTMTVRTRWAGLSVLDYMPIPAADDPNPVRIIRTVRGDEPAHITFAPRPEFGSVSTSFEVERDGLLVVSGAEPIALYSPGVDWHITEQGGQQIATAIVDPSERDFLFDLRFASSDLSPIPQADADLRQRSEQVWQDWLAECSLPGIRPDAEERAALTVRALSHVPTGALLSAASTSLPEHIGGVRNWDTRYCWLRDAAIATRELAEIGSMEEAEKFVHWLMSMKETLMSADRLHPVYALSGQSMSSEAVLDALPGYAGSRPVRIGNAAQGQLQLDIFGQVLLLLDTLARIQDRVSDNQWLLTEQLADAITARWHESDHGIWQTRMQPRHHTHSRMMCWVGMDCALRIATRRGVDRPEWRNLQDSIENDIETNGWNTIRSSYVAAYDLAEADAAVLQAFIEGYPAPPDRMQRTIGFIEQQLRRPSGVYRYRYDDGLPLGQGTMHVCSAWLAASHVDESSEDEAMQMLDTMLSAAGGTGLLPEQVDPKSRRGLGNHPHVLSQAGVLMLTRHIASRRRASH